MPSRSTRSFFWSFLEQGGSKAVAMLVQIVLARMLAPEAFGVMAILLVVTSVADSVAQGGLGMALIQKRDADSKSYSTCWWLSLGVAVALYLVIFATAPFLALAYAMPELSGYLRVLGVVVVFNAANSIQRSFLQKAMDFKRVFKVSFSAIALSGLVGIACAYAGMGVWSLVAQSLGQSVAVFFAMLAVVPWKPTLSFDMREARELFSYGWKICATGILNVLYTGLSELVIGKACSAVSLGYYSQGRKYPMAAIGTASNAMQNVMFPLFSGMQDDLASLRAEMRRMLDAGTYVIAALSVLLAVAAEPIVAILLTERWLPCVPVFQFACLSGCVTMLQLVNLRAYMALGCSGLYLRLQVVKVLLGVVVICGTAMLTGDIYLTAAATCLVSVASVLAVDMPPAKRVHGYRALRQLRDQSLTYVSCLAAAAVAYPVSFLGLGYGAELVLEVATFAVVYLGLSSLLNLRGLQLAKGLVGLG